MKKAWKNVHLNVEMKIFKTKVHLQLNSTYISGEKSSKHKF